MPEIDPVAIEAFIEKYVIPIKPEIKVSLEKEFNSTDPSIQSIGALIRQDVSALGGILQVANSSKSKKKFISVVDAVNDLGLAKVKEIINEVIKREHSLNCDSLRFDRFWDSSREVAIISCYLAEKCESKDQEEAYLLGLFRHCGIPFMLQVLTGYKRVLQEAENNPEKKIIDLENEEFYINHQVVGYCASRKWCLPDTVSYAILSHHSVRLNMTATEMTKKRDFLVSLTYVSEAISDKYHAEERSISPKNFKSSNKGNNWPEFDAYTFECLGLPESELYDLMDQILEDLPAVLKLL